MYFYFLQYTFIFYFYIKVKYVFYFILDFEVGMNMPTRLVKYAILILPK
jgi:hypothetical protein